MKNLKSDFLDESDYLDSLGPLFFKYGFDVARIHYLSVDEQAIVCKKYYEEGNASLCPEGLRIKISKAPYINYVIKNKKIKIWSYSNDKELLGTDLYRDRLDKSNVQEWIESPLIDTESGNVFGLICLHSLNPKYHFSDEDLNNTEQITSEISNNLYRLKKVEEAKLKEEVIDKLINIDKELLYEIYNINPTRPWKVDLTYDHCAKFLFDLVNADFIHIRKRVKNLLIPLSYEGHLKISDKVINIKNSKGKQFLSCKAVIENKSQYFIGKLDSSLINTMVELLGYSHDNVILFKNIRSSASVPIKIKNNIIGTLYVASTDWDFLTKTNVIIIEDFANKLSLIMSMDKKLSDIASVSSEHFKKIIELRDAIEKKMRFTVMQEMASGFLHDFKNSVGPCNASIDAVKNIIQKRPNLMKSKSLMDSINIIERNTKLMSSLLDTYDRIKYTNQEHTVFKIADAIDEAINICSYRAERKRIDFQVRINEPNTKILGSKVDIIMVFVNVIANAIDSMVEGKGSGKMLSIRTEKREKKYITYISDMGCGIRNEIKRKIFEPYFSSRWESGGTGIGLYSVSRTLNSHNGDIRLKSTHVNKGSTFEITLPTLEDA